MDTYKRSCHHPRRRDRRERALKHVENRVLLWDRVIAEKDNPPSLEGHLGDPYLSATKAMMEFGYAMGGLKRDQAIRELGHLRRKLGISVLGAPNKEES